jgi:hypothetical protein
MKAVFITEANTDLHGLTARGGRCAIAEAIGGSEDATLGHQIYRRMSALGRFIPADRQPLVADLEDQFARVAGVADGQVRYLG